MWIPQSNITRFVRTNIRLAQKSLQCVAVSISASFEIKDIKDTNLIIASKKYSDQFETTEDYKISNKLFGIAVFAKRNKKGEMEYYYTSLPHEVHTLKNI